MDYKKAIQQIRQRRKNDLLISESKLLDALRQHPELRKLDVEIRSLEIDQRIGKEVDSKHLSQLKTKRNNYLKKLGISLDTPPRCNFCKDTGVFENKPCSCVISLVTPSHSPDFSFKNSDLSVFDKADRPKVEKVYEVMLTFCKSFPDTKAKNIVFLGRAGTGKTFLAACIANQLLIDGFSVVFVSAFGFVNQMLKYHTAPIEEKLLHISPLIDCDLLVIDDLGTENILRNVTIEYLYNVLNERIRLKKHILITTNLDQEGLAARYGERIFSRLCDKRSSSWIVLAEKDVRK